MSEVAALNQQLDNSLQEELLKDIEDWFSNCLMYNESFLENQELINKLAMACEEADSSDVEVLGRTPGQSAEAVG